MVRKIKQGRPVSYFFLCNLDKVSQRPNKGEGEKSCKDKWGRAF